MAALLRELDLRQEWLASPAGGGAVLRPRTIFFGGGTPTALTTPQLTGLLAGLRSRLDLSDLAEWTVEMNPATVSLEKARGLRELGVNRVSMGVQSWDPGLLLTLGRVHTADQARRSYEILRAAGFDNVNLDLIFAVPGQTRATWLESLRRTVALRPDHVSAYNLTYEEDTEFFRRHEQGEFVVDPDADADLFELTADELAGAGYAPYEISNFARPGCECAHNLAYWLGADYLGLGPSAFSTVGPRRWANVRDTAAYSAAFPPGSAAAAGAGAGGWPVGFEEEVSPAVRRTELIAFGLRTNRGVSRELLRPWSAQVAAHEELGLLATDPQTGQVLLTRRGRLLADAVAADYV